MLADGLEAADFIKTFVVQAKLNPRGNFGEACMPAAHNLIPSVVLQQKAVPQLSAEMQVQPEHADATAEEAALRGKKP